MRAIKKILLGLAVTSIVQSSFVFASVGPATDLLVPGVSRFKTTQFIETASRRQKIEEQVRILELNRNNVNENGKIMIVMYHGLGDKNGSYTRKTEDFKKDLERLYQEGYTLVSMQSYIEGTFDVPIGRTPIILTFDDGNESNFRFLETDDGYTIDPECAVGIIDAFFEKYPDLGRHAIFYLNKDNPFGQPQYLTEKLDYLLEHGYEIGNHTMHHLSLATLDAEGIQKAIGGNVSYFASLDKAYTLTSMALPFGERPSDKTLRNYLFEGSYQGEAYVNHLILLVGAEPERPLYLYESSPYTLSRVQSGDGDFQLAYWLDYFERHKSKRFYSDGDPQKISVPSEGERLTYHTELEVYRIPVFKMGG